MDKQFLLGYTAAGVAFAVPVGGICSVLPFHVQPHGEWIWVVPFFILLSGIVIHAQFTGRWPLCFAWIVGFVVQGLFRGWLYGNRWYVPLVSMSSALPLSFSLCT